MRQLGHGTHRGDFHFVRDGRGAGVQRTAEDVGEAQDIVDLVWVVASARGHDGVIAHGFDFFRRDFGVRVGQRKDDRLGRHALDHVRFEHAAGRQAEENVGAINHLAQGAGGGFLCKRALVVVHQLGAAFINHAGQIGHEDVLVRHAHLEQQAQAGQCRRSRAGGDKLDGLDVLAHDLEAVEQAGGHHDGRAMLVVMEDRDLHALTQLAFDVETVGRLDVFQIDAAKGRLQGGNDVHELVEVVFLVDLDVKNIDTGELLEQHALAFHHRLGRQRANITQAQHGRAIGDDGHQVAAAGVLEGVIGVLDDFFARRRDTRGIGQGQVMLVDQLLGGSDGNLAGGGELVVLESGLAQLGAFIVRLGRRTGHHSSPAATSLAEKANPRDALHNSRCARRGFCGMSRKAQNHAPSGSAQNGPFAHQTACVCLRHTTRSVGGQIIPFWTRTRMAGVMQSIPKPIRQLL